MGGGGAKRSRAGMKLRIPRINRENLVITGCQLFSFVIQIAKRIILDYCFCLVLDSSEGIKTFSNLSFPIMMMKPSSLATIRRS